VLLWLQFYSRFGFGYVLTKKLLKVPGMNQFRADQSIYLKHNNAVLVDIYNLKG